MPGAFSSSRSKAGWLAEGTEINERTATLCVGTHRRPRAQTRCRLSDRARPAVQRDHADGRSRAHSDPFRSWRCARRRCSHPMGGSPSRCPAVRRSCSRNLARPDLIVVLPAHGGRQPGPRQSLFSARSPERSSAPDSSTFRDARCSRVPSRGERVCRASVLAGLHSMARLLPGGLHTPLTLNLQAYGRRPAAERERVPSQDVAGAPELSVVIPTFNNVDVLRRCLTAGG